MDSYFELSSENRRANATQASLGWQGLDVGRPRSPPSGFDGGATIRRG